METTRKQTIEDNDCCYKCKNINPSDEGIMHEMYCVNKKCKCHTPSSLDTTPKVVNQSEEIEAIYSKDNEGGIHMTEEVLHSKEDFVEDWVEKFEEYAYQVSRVPNCGAIFDHDITWCGDCYACCNCGKKFIWTGIANKSLSSNTERVKKNLQYLVNRANGENLMIPPKTLQDIINKIK